jgi:hypothetical protein
VDRVVLQRADHLEPGPVTDMGQPGVAVSAEVALENQALFGAVEQGAPALQLEHAVRRLLSVQLGHAPVVDHLAAAHGVAEVDLPVVLGPHVTHGGGDAALGHDRVSLAQERLADEADRHALVRGLDGRPQPGAARPDDDDVVLVRLVRWCGHQKMILRSVILPIATSRMYRSASPTLNSDSHAYVGCRSLRRGKKCHTR